MPRKVGFRRGGSRTARTRVKGKRSLRARTLGRFTNRPYSIVARECQPLKLRPKRRALEPLRLEERLHEIAVAQHKVGQRSLLPGELLRIFERAFEDEPGDGIDIDRGDVATQTHRFERDRAPAGERIEHSRGAATIGLANFVPEELQVGTRLAPPMENAADGLLALDFDRLALDLLFFDLGNDAPTDTLDQPATLLRVTGVGQQRGDQRRAASRKWPSGRPYMERRDMPMPDILLVHGIQRRLLQGECPLDETSFLTCVFHAGPP